MADEGTTNVGNITGKLRLDSSAWNAELDAAKAKANELRNVNPEVRVSANTAAADAKLEETAAVASALGKSDPTIKVKADTSVADAWLAATANLEAALDARVTAANARIDALGRSYEDAAPSVERFYSSTTRARMAEEAATQAAVDGFKARVQATAQMRQEEVEAQRATAQYNEWSAALKESASSSDVLSASNAKQLKAMLDLDDANKKVADARGVLNDLQKAGGASESELAAATRALSEAQIGQSAAATAVKDAMDGAGASTMSFGKVAMPAAVLGVVELLSTIGPLAAGLIGIGAGFLGMSAAGVAAIIGIKQEMQEGTDEGNRYSTLITGLKTDMEDLAHTAAGGVLDGFEKSIDAVDKQMPGLRAEAQDMASAFGKAGSNVIDGLVHGLVVAKPLLDDGAQVLEKWSSEFDSWMSNGGFEKFVSYARAQLPQVVSTVEDLGTAVVDVVKGLSDNGSDVLRMLDTMAKGFNNAADAGAKFQGWLDSNPVTKFVSRMISPGGLINAITGASDGASKASESGKQLNATYEQGSSDASSYALSASALSSEFGDLSTQGTLAQQAATQLSTALQNLDNGAISASQAETAFNQAIADATTGLAQHGAGLDENTQKGRDNQNALDSIANSALTLIGAQAKAGESTATLNGTMQTAHDQFVQAATAAGMNADQAENLAHQYGLIPGNVSTVVDAQGISDVQLQIDKLNAEIAILQGGHTIDLYVNTHQTGTMDTVAKASGGTLFANTGRTIPDNGPYIDSVHLMAAPGEEVISNRVGQADRYRPILKGINGNASPEALAGMLGVGMGAPQRQQSGSGVFTGSLYLSSGEFLGMVQGEIKQALDQEAQVASAGVTTAAGWV